jgi:predicted GIY-YIG superfamily endonuclease
MLLRDRLQARFREMGAAPDYVRLAEEVLAIRNATPSMARRLIDQALVVEDRRETWLRLGERIVASAPESAGVYVLRDAGRRPLYVGKAINIRRRLRTHFASRRWKAMKSELSRVEDVVWHEVGSELEALLLEARWIRELAPTVNVQRGEPVAGRPRSSRHTRDVIVLLPSVAEDSVELIAARTSGPTLIQRTRKDGRDLAADAERIWMFYEVVEPAGGLAPIVFSWLAHRGGNVTRFDVSDLVSAEDLRLKLSTALASPELFSERLVIRTSSIEPSPRAPRDRIAKPSPTSPFAPVTDPAVPGRARLRYPAPPRCRGADRP